LSVLVVGAYVVALGLGSGLRPRSVASAEHDVHDMPYVLGEWQGRDEPLDEKVVEAIGTDIVANRVYRNARGGAVSLHSALFAEYDKGVEHHPYNCLRCQEWRLAEQKDMPLDVGDGKSVTIIFSTWERGNDRLYVAYWYQLDEYIILSRVDLGKVRWQMGRREAWPVLAKFLLQTSAPDADQAEARLKSLAEKAFCWARDNLNQAPPQE